MGERFVAGPWPVCLLNCSAHYRTTARQFRPKCCFCRARCH